MDGVYRLDSGGGDGHSSCAEHEILLRPKVIMSFGCVVRILSGIRLQARSSADGNVESSRRYRPCFFSPTVDTAGR